jgi:UDP-N-acetylglucosamine acyltransferase
MFFTKKNYTVSKTAIIGKKSKIGDYCVVEDGVIVKDNVTLGEGTRLMNHSIIGDNTEIGKYNTVHPFAVIGGISQDYKYTDEPTNLKIGNKNVFREYVTINRGTSANSTTMIGNNNLFCAYSHVGHDSTVKDYVTVGNYAALGGHAVIMSNARVCAFSAISPYCRMGDYSFLAANSMCILDLIPYAIAEGSPAKLRGVNIWKLKKINIRDSIPVIKKIYKILVDNKHIMSEKLPLINNIDPSDTLGIQSYIISSKFGVINNE